MTERNNCVGQLRQFKLNTSDWSVFKPHLHNYFTANEIKSSVKKRAILLNMLDEEAYKLITSLCHPVSPENTPLITLMLLFDGHFESQVSVFAERYKFYNAMRHRGESVEDWAARVKIMATACQFGAELEVCLRDKFIFGLADNVLNLFGDNVNISFEDAVKLAREKKDLNQDDCYNKVAPCCSNFYMVRDHHDCPFGCYAKGLHLGHLYWYNRYGFPISCEQFY